jgi:hypothetical protein
MTPWGEIFFPYAPSLRDESDAEVLRAACARHDDPNEVVEIYAYAPDGSVSVTVRNCTQGYERRYELGDLA